VKIAIIVFLGGILTALAFVPLSAAVVFGTLATLIVCGIIINGREREFDLAGLVKVISNITRREK
jgi:predicted DNA repair protein MutK